MPLFKFYRVWFALTSAVLFLSLFAPSYAQSSKSLSEKESEQDSIEIISDQAYELYHKGDLEEAIDLTSKALKRYEDSGNLDGIVQMLNTKGNIYRFAGDYENALHYFFLTLEHFQALANKKGQASTLNQIGSIYRMQGNYPVALEYFFSSLKLYNEINDNYGLSKVLNNVGVVYFYQKNYDKALEYYQQSLKQDEYVKDEYGVSVSFINIGEVYQHKGEFKQALDYYLRALILAKKYEDKDEDKDGVGVLYNEIGAIYTELGDLNLSSTYLNQAHSIFKSIENKQRLSECNLNLGKLAVKKNNNQQAINHFFIALEYAKEIGALDLIAQSNRMLSKVFESTNNSTKAFDHYKVYIQFRDSLFNEDNTKKTVQAEMLYQFEKQMQESRLEQAKKDAIVQEIARRQSMLRNFMTALVLMLVIIIVVIYSAYKSKHRANEQLNLQQKEILEKNEELLQQQEEILAQRDEIQIKNKILLETQQIVEAKNDRIISSIEYAQTIQEAILPNEEQLQQYFPDHMVVFLPKDIVSGDFYWFSSIDNLLFAAVIDCTGHGVPGSFMSLIGNTLLNQIVNEWQTRDPALILELMHIQVRKALKQESNTGKAHASMDVCLLTIDPQKRKATFAGASRPLYIIQNGKLTRIPGDPRSVGGFQKETKRYFTNIDINLLDSTQIYLTTDGYVDQMDENLKKIGGKRFSKILLENHIQSMTQQKDSLVNAFLHHKKDFEQIDDICILGLKL